MTEPKSPREFTPQEKLMAALVAARREMPPIPMSATARIKSKKGEKSSYTFRYAPLPKIIEIISPVLAKHGLMLSTPPTKHGLQISVLHEGGGVMSFEGPDIPKFPDVKDWGAACTYLRRYSVMGVLGLVADEDADGDALPGPAPEPPAPTKAQPPADAPPEEVVLERIEQGFRFLQLPKEEQASLWEQHPNDPDGLLVVLHRMARELKAAEAAREPGQEG